MLNLLWVLILKNNKFIINCPLCIQMQIFFHSDAHSQMFIAMHAFIAQRVRLKHLITILFLILLSLPSCYNGETAEASRKCTQAQIAKHCCSEATSRRHRIKHRPSEPHQAPQAESEPPARRCLRCCHLYCGLRARMAHSATRLPSARQIADSRSSNGRSPASEDQWLAP